jgi:tetratricopeptide (TPR) repeat protein
MALRMALSRAKAASDLRSVMEALSGLLRLASEALDEAEIKRLDAELEALMRSNPQQIPPLAWHCKGVAASYRRDTETAQRCFHRYLRAVRSDPESGEEAVAKAWVMLAINLSNRGLTGRAMGLAREILRRYEVRSFRSINGITYLLLGNLFERDRALEESMRWYQRAHASFLGEHNWFYHLYVLYGYARVHRLQRNYSQAYWNLDLLEKAAAAPEFGLLRREIAIERTRLQQDAVDLLIDSRKGVVKTRESGPISLRKQYVLLHILEALSQAHGQGGAEAERGLSKSEIIGRVWRESYRPEAHDNKLYYNINRLRKLIEPDVRKPQYLLNWKEGYRLAPGLRVQFVGARTLGEGTQTGGKLS